MRTQDFDKFVSSQQVSDIDWDGMRNEWLRDLESLYARIADFLDDYVQARTITYKFSRIELSEENLGEYLAKKMDIKIGKQSVSLVPVGTLLVASKGRVDVLGSAGRAQLLLVDERAKTAADLFHVTVSVGKKVPPPPPWREQISWAWKIVPNANPRRFVDLTKQSFLDLLMSIAGAKAIRS